MFNGNGSGEFRQAIGRMIALRKPSQEALAGKSSTDRTRICVQYCAELNRNQRRAMFTSRGSIFRLQKLFNFQRSHSEVSFVNWLVQPHPKRLQRWHTHTQHLERGYRLDKKCRNVEYKLKNGEFLPAGKKRGIGDLNADRTSATAHNIAEYKHAMEGEFFHHGSVISEFIATPDKGVLSAGFSKLLDPPPGKIAFIYFSDDCSFSARCKDGLSVNNGDISACDGSHTDAIINKLQYIMTHNPITKARHYDADSIDLAFSFLAAPLSFKNTTARKGEPGYKERVLYHFRQKRLYSGSVLTTLLNNFANFCIADRLSQLVPDPRLISRADFEKCYVRAARQVGYGVKCQSCLGVNHDVIPEKIQFLKHSPSVIMGVVVPWVNIAVFTRGFGIYKGTDLPGVKGQSVENRIATYVSDVVESRSNWGNHPINSAFSHLSGLVLNDAVTRPPLYMEAIGKGFNPISTGTADVDIPLECIAARYDVSVAQLEELVLEIKRSRVHSVVCLPVIGIIHKLDYG